MKLHADSLESFLRIWESTLAGLAEVQPKANLQDLLADQFRKSKRLELDLRIYDRAEQTGGPEFSYEFLMERLRVVVEKAQEDKARAQQVEALRRVGSGGAGQLLSLSPPSKRQRPRPAPSLRLRQSRNRGLRYRQPHQRRPTSLQLA